MDKERFERDFEHYKNGLQQNLNEREVTLMLHSYCMGYCEMINHVNEDVDGMYLVNPVLEKISELSSDFSKHFNSSKKDFSIEDVDKEILRLKNLKNEIKKNEKNIKKLRKDILRSWQERLKQTRELRGLTLGDISDEIGVSKQSISRWENMNKPISFERAEQISKVLNYDLNLKG
jgi:DNA-binding XRE family transcriptional regulator